MPTPSGTISLNDVNVELGFAGTTLISMNQSDVRTLAGVGGSGTIITMQNLQGKSNRVTANLTISSDTANYTLNTAKVTGYSAGKTDVTLTINSGIFVYSASTGSYAFTVDNSWTTGDTITIVNNGVIQGRGGNGGNASSGAGNSGGPALNVQRATSINNGNRIAGGGGGGGAGAAYYQTYKFGTVEERVGGGGGGGLGISTGGSRAFDVQGQPSGVGGNGTLTSAGSGGAASQGSTIAGAGGSGGSYGSSGSNGLASGGSGGAGGAAVVGNSNITWIATGTRNGSIS